MSRDLLQFFTRQNYEELVISEHMSESAQCAFSPRVLALAQSLFQNLDSPEKKARAAYEYIRNQILYSFEPWEESAEATLQKMKGNCFHKSKVMVALLRSEGIPCVFSSFLIDKRSFSWFLDSATYGNLPQESLHVYVEVFLNGAWRRYVDTSIDQKLRQKLLNSGVDPFDCVVLEKTIRRFFSPEEIQTWMKKQKPPLALGEINADLLQSIQNKISSYR